jgi:exopolysaccharide biosynthesis protein
LLIGKTRFDKVDQVEKNKTLRSKKIKDMKTTFDLDAKRDPNRLVAPTHTSTANKVSLEDLDYAERKRTVINAHDSKVAFSGRDLKFSGRAVPAWCNPPKIN